MRRTKIALLFIIRALGLFALARWLTRDCLKILCYHGFALRDEQIFRPKLFMSASLFGKRLSTLARLGYRVLPLDQAVEDLYAGRTRKDAIAITVDDGFRSFYDSALPLLRQHGFPATVYVTSYYVAHANPVFRLLLQYVFWKAEPRCVEVRGLAGIADERIDLSRKAEADRLLWACIDHGEQRCDETQRRELGREIGQRLGVDVDDLVSGHVMELMRPEQLAELAPAGVKVELHTHRHRFPADDRLLAQAEIIDNRRALGAWLPEAKFQHFCYPSGNWDACQWAWLDEVGVHSSTTCESRLNSLHTPRHALGRILDGEDVHPIEFEAAISGFTDLVRRVLGRNPKPLMPAGS